MCFVCTENKPELWTAAITGAESSLPDPEAGRCLQLPWSQAGSGPESCPGERNVNSNGVCHSREEISGSWCVRFAMFSASPTATHPGGGALHSQL